jgi:hypothetical protein
MQKISYTEPASIHSKLEDRLPQKPSHIIHLWHQNAQIPEIKMHQRHNRKAGGQYLANAQLVEHILKNLVVLNHIIFSLGVEINLQSTRK